MLNSNLASKITRTLSKIENINIFRNYENHHFPVPPIEEQKKILEYLKDKTELIKKMIRNQEKKIKILKELKYSLISEVIAGRKKLDRMNGE